MSKTILGTCSQCLKPIRLGSRYKRDGGRLFHLSDAVEVIDVVTGSDGSTAPMNVGEGDCYARYIQGQLLPPKGDEWMQIRIGR